MVRNLLIAGMLVGIVAGLLSVRNSLRYGCLGCGRRGSSHRLFPHLREALDEDVADRDKEDADQGRDGHTKHDCGAHDTA